jgi:hypothetical protein
LQFSYGIHSCAQIRSDLVESSQTFVYGPGIERLAQIHLIPQERKTQRDPATFSQEFEDLLCI